jgi:hypothetical protein
MRTILLCALLVCACKKDPGDTSQMPKLPPSPKAQVPAALQIAVEIDGKPAPTIDGVKLQQTKADYEDEERRAWRFDTLVGPAASRPGVAIAVTGEKDVSVVLRAPRAATDPIPVLAQSRRGGVVAALVPADDPFPPYHGQGRRMARPGDPLPRMNGVTKISVYLAK